MDFILWIYFCFSEHKKTMLYGIFTYIYYCGLFIYLAFQKITQGDWEDGSISKMPATQTRGPQFSVPASRQKLVMRMPRLLALRW